MEDVFKTMNLSHDSDIFRGYSEMIDLYNAIKVIAMIEMA